MPGEKKIIYIYIYIIHSTFSSDNTSLTNDKMSSTALLIALKLGFWRKNVIHGTFSSANTSLSNEKMSLQHF